MDIENSRLKGNVYLTLNSKFKISLRRGVNLLT